MAVTIPDLYIDEVNDVSFAITVADNGDPTTDNDFVRVSHISGASPLTYYQSLPLASSSTNQYGGISGGNILASDHPVLQEHYPDATSGSLYIPWGITEATPTTEYNGKTYIEARFRLYGVPTTTIVTLWMQYIIIADEFLINDTNKWYDVYVENLLGTTTTTYERQDLQRVGTSFAIHTTLTKEEVSAKYNIPVDQIPDDVIGFGGNGGRTSVFPAIELGYKWIIQRESYSNIIPSNIDIPVTDIYWDTSRYFGEGTLYFSLDTTIMIETSPETSESVRLTLDISVPKIPGEMTKTPADMQAISDLLHGIPNTTITTSSYYWTGTKWTPDDINPQTIHNVVVTDNETPAGEGVTIVGEIGTAPDPLQGFTVEYSTVTINTPNDKIENEGSAVIIQPGGDINVFTQVGMLLEAPEPTHDDHVITKRYVDSVVAGGSRAQVVDHLYDTIFDFPAAPVVSINFSLGGSAREVRIDSERLGYSTPANVIFSSYDEMVKHLHRRCWEYGYSLRRNFMPTEDEWNAGDLGDFN